MESTHAAATGGKRSAAAANSNIRPTVVVPAAATTTDPVMSSIDVGVRACAARHDRVGKRNVYVAEVGTMLRRK